MRVTGGEGGRLDLAEGRALAESTHAKKKICPQCRQETFEFLKTCPSCGFQWPDLELLRAGREPGRRLLIGFAVLLAILLGSFCVLYAVLLSFSGRGAS